LPTASSPRRRRAHAPATGGRSPPCSPTRWRTCGSATW
jgi:hypothetical protein